MALVLINQMLQKEETSMAQTKLVIMMIEEVLAVELPARVTKRKIHSKIYMVRIKKVRRESKKE